MKKLIFLSLFTLLSAGLLQAKDWRINPSNKSKADYADINAAMASHNVKAGDRLLIDAGTYQGGTQTVTKSVTIVGVGYFLGENKEWGESATSVIEYLTIEALNTTVEGIVCNKTIKINAEYVTISRSQLRGELDLLASNATISQCYILGRYYGYNKYSNITINNNIILHEWTSSNRMKASTFKNNIVIANSRGAVLDCFEHSEIRDNIVINTNTEFTDDGYSYYYYSNNTIDMNPDLNNSIVNNVLSTDAEHISDSYRNNHYVGATIEDIFVNEGTNDGKYKLKAGSAAIGAASTGGDCGAFGSSTPYVLSGVPRYFPHITEAIVPDAPTNGKLSVQLKVEVQNE